MSKKYELDAEEQAIEDQIEQFQSVKDVETVKKNLVEAAKKHTKNKKPITIRIAVHDLEAIKIKASKYGIPYQTYLNMLIHKDATSI